MQDKKYWILRMIGASLLFAETASAANEAVHSPVISNMLSYILLGVGGVVIIGALTALYQLTTMMIKIQQIRIYQENGLTDYLEAAKQPRKIPWKKIYQRWTKAVPVAKEKDIMLDHGFDGIYELDNSLPPWWVAMFYITIVLGVGYFGYYHVLGWGLSSAEEYALEMEEAEEAKAAFLENQADLVDETNVIALEDAQAISMGETVFKVNCAACHGQLGEGGVGPNLTDAYWIHGGDVKNIFKTIKYGVPEKGMIAWSTQLRPADIQRLSSYILTLQGTNPPNSKEPQGDLYQQANQETVPTSDTTTVAAEGAIGMIEQ
ncbi:MAG: cbb3-type cytochrome c oxidase N-terminal domain-containing protein [Bacteroidota bacterium]